MRTLQCFQKNFFLPTKCWKNHPQKLLRKTQIHFFFLTASTAKMAQTEEFMFQNVAYRPTVNWTGGILLTNKLLCRWISLKITLISHDVWCTSLCLIILNWQGKKSLHNLISKIKFLLHTFRVLWHSIYVVQVWPGLLNVLAWSNL